MTRRRTVVLLLPALLALAAAGSRGRLQAAPADAPTFLVTGKAITPQGRQTGVGSFPCNLLLSPDGRYLVATNTGYRQFLSCLSAADGSLVSQVEFSGVRQDGSGRKEGLYYGLAFGPPAADGTLLYVSRGAEDRISVFRLTPEGRLVDTGRALDNPSGITGFRAPHHVAGLAVNADGTRLYAVNNHTSAFSQNRGSLSVLDPAANRVVRKILLPGFPLGAAAVTRGPHAGRVYVSSERDGVVSVVDPEAGRVLRDVPTGDHPTALLLDRAQERLFVANSGSDTVSILEVGSERLASTVLLRPNDARGLPGATPLGMALSPDERRLYVALGDMNAVAVVDVPGRRLAGYLPAGWYPTAAAVSPDGRRLFVANAKGVSERNPNGAPAGPDGKWGQYIQNIIEGTVATLDLPDREALARATQQVVRNNRLAAGDGRAARDFRNPGIRHVIYVIKENRTYDQVFGDLPQGNGDPKLCLFPREVSPNHHALAERFVLLDNFYCCAEVSADGWNWSTSGMASEYVARNAPYGYSGRGRSYDYEGANNGVVADLEGLPDVARAPGGYIWDQAAKKGLDYRNYGFFVNVELSEQGVPKEGPAGSAGNRATKKALVSHTDENFRQFDMTYADGDAWVLHNAPAPLQKREFGRFRAPSRFAAWKREFDGFVQSGRLPRFMTIRLPRDHTQGTALGQHSPRAMVADNDYALGQIVEAVSKSPFWKETAIFVLEDDAQNGFDHVDAHRSPCLVIGPFVRGSTVDHRFYNTDSVLRTMELLLGLPPMSQYDAVASPLDVFGTRAENDAPYAPILPARRIVAEINGSTAYRAADSGRLNLTQADAVPDEVMNDILWHALKGRSTPKPPLRYGLRLLPAGED